MAGLRAHKAVFCEWPLGATLAEAQEMATFAKAHGLKTIVGLQARSDPTLMYARDLIHQGYIGKVLTANLRVISQQVLERGAGRIWQGDRTNGANTLTIAGGHALDGLCYVLGEFEALAARLATRITAWKNTETGQTCPSTRRHHQRRRRAAVAAPRCRCTLQRSPSTPAGHAWIFYGRDGTMVIVAPGSFNIGPNVLYAAQGNAPLAEMPAPAPYTLVPEGPPPGPPRNVAQAYRRAAQAFAAGTGFEVDFRSRGGAPHADRRDRALGRGGAGREAVGREGGVAERWLLLLPVRKQQRESSAVLAEESGELAVRDQPRCHTFRTSTQA